MEKKKSKKSKNFDNMLVRTTVYKRDNQPGTKNQPNCKYPRDASGDRHSRFRQQQPQRDKSSMEQHRVNRFQ